MARPASGHEQLESARRAVREAKTVDELRAAQSVLLPLEFGLSLEQTGIAIGRSAGRTCVIRNSYCRIASNLEQPSRAKTDLRNRAYLTMEEEAALIDAVFTGANQGSVLVVPPLHQAICDQLGRTIALSSVYRLLNRHGWRKVSPDTEHPKGNAQVRENWKKNSRTHWQKR
jgi:hypothetical protein